ncbi:MAG: hypothetical protein AAGI53_01610 [Planctomycetota bacterium]
MDDHTCEREDCRLSFAAPCPACGRQWPLGEVRALEVVTGDAVPQLERGAASTLWRDVPPPPAAKAFTEDGRFVSGNGYGGERL